MRAQQARRSLTRTFRCSRHATRRWAKKIRGKLHYFGPWRDPDGALKKYLEQRDDLYAGRTPSIKTDGYTLRDLANRFLTHKRHLADTREITERTFGEYHATCALLLEAFGRDRAISDLRPEDFEQLRASLAKKWGPVTLANVIQKVWLVFRYADAIGMIERPMRFGPGFARPSKKSFVWNGQKRVAYVRSKRTTNHLGCCRASIESDDPARCKCGVR